METRRRRPVVWLAIVVAGAFAVSPGDAAAEASSTAPTGADPPSKEAALPTLADLVEIYEQKLDAVQSVRIDSTETQTPIVPRNDLFQKLGYLVWPALTDQPQTQAVHRDGLLYDRQPAPDPRLESRFEERLQAEIPGYAAGTTGLQDVDFNRLAKIRLGIAEQLAGDDSSVRSEEIRVFDGERLWRHRTGEEILTEGVTRKVFEVINPGRLSSNFFSETLLDDLLLSVESPLESEREFRGKNRLGELAQLVPLEVLDRTQEVDGHECIVLETPGEHWIALDPEIGYAVRKRSWFMDGQLVWEFTADRFEQDGESVWIPRRYAQTQYGLAKFHGEPFDGKPLFRMEGVVTHVAVDNPTTDALFAMTPTAGAWVVDETLPAIAPDGSPTIPSTEASNEIPTVSYIQPADARDLELVARKAQEGAGKPKTTGRAALQRGEDRNLLLWFNFAAVATVVGLLIVRKVTA